MVLVGFPKRFDKQQIIEYMLCNGIRRFEEYSFDAIVFYEFQIKPNCDDIYFFEVETECLEKYGLCCFGEQQEYYNAKKNTAVKQLCDNVLKYEEDINFWLSFVEKSCETFGSIALYKYYPDIDIPHTVSFIKSSKINADVLLGMQNNHIVVVQDEEIITGKRETRLAIGFDENIPTEPAINRLSEFGFNVVSNEKVYLNNFCFVEIEMNYEDMLSFGIGSYKLLREYKSFEKSPIYEHIIKEKVQKIEQSAEKWNSILKNCQKSLGR